MKRSNCNNGNISNVPNDVCTTYKCCNEYLCRTDACKKRLQIELLEKMEHYLNLAPPLSLHSSCDTNDTHRTLNQDHRHFEDEKLSTDQVNSLINLAR